MPDEIELEMFKRMTDRVTFLRLRWGPLDEGPPWRIVMLDKPGNSVVREFVFKDRAAVEDAISHALQHACKETPEHYNLKLTNDAKLND